MGTQKHWFTKRVITIALFAAGMVWIGFSKVTRLQEAADAAMGKKETSLAAFAESGRQLTQAVYERKEPVSEAGSWGLLASILYSARVSSVVIDGEILHEGDTIHGVKVVGINEDTVELAKDDERWQQTVGMGFPGEAGSV